MPNKSVLLFVVLALSSLMFAQANQQQSTVGGVQPSSATCLFNFSSGSGQSLTTYCVTQNGNIAEFSANGTEFINSPGPAIEGFGMCDNTAIGSSLDYFDYASSDSGNWNPATATLNGTTVVVNRTTTDGHWQLTQTITDMKAFRGAYGSARVTMAIKNLSNIERFLVAFRYAQVNPAPFPFADFDTTPTTALAMTPSAGGPGLSSTGTFIISPTNTDFSVARVFQTTTPPDPCGINNVSTTFFEGTGGILQNYSLDIKPNATRTISMTYRPI
jgi:hypothetical protein